MILIFLMMFISSVFLVIYTHRISVSSNKVKSEAIRKASSISIFKPELDEIDEQMLAEAM
jgi:hypothetical protein